MFRSNSTRREFLRSVAATTAAGVFVPYWLTGQAARANGFKAKSDRPLVGAIGVGGRGTGVAQEASLFGDVVAVCDVDRKNAERAKNIFGGKPEIYTDYRKLLERKDLEVITNGTPDHWHTAVNIAACKAGKDVYTEKPMTLTIDEGKLLRKVVQETGRIVQVGTQQRSEAPFRTACELVRNGRVGKLKEVIVMLPFWTTKGGPFPTQPVPPDLNWDLYQGQAPERPYSPQRTHFNFRWWSIYAGGIITDWGQHHMDIAHWGMGVEDSGPLSVEGKAFFPNRGKPDCFDNPDRFVARMKYPGDVDLLYLVVRDDKYLKSMKDGDISEAEDAELFAGVPDEWKKEQRNGIMFIGDQGRVFVNRGGVYGKPAEDLKNNPLPANAVKLYASNNHMQNFFECVTSRKAPISPVDIGHRVITACHLGNIALRLKRKIAWDPVKEEIVGDAEAASSLYMRRPQRAPYQIQA
jgi:myo-inositol 2-dehydrogenase/D-chiro-inositol 1-dehydrogenase